MYWMIPLLLIGAKPIPPPSPMVEQSLRTYALVPDVVEKPRLQLPPLPATSELESDAKVQVELLLFGAQYCAPYKRMKSTVDRLSGEGWQVHYVDIDETRGERWTKYCRANTKSVPYLLVLIDDMPWEHVRGERNHGWLADWLHRAENAWRTDHGIEPVPFEAYGDTTLKTPMDREFFYKEHWQMTMGTCGMFGCTAHGGGWRKEQVKVFRDEPTTEVPIQHNTDWQRPSPTTRAPVSSGCPSCGTRGFF